MCEVSKPEILAQLNRFLLGHWQLRYRSTYATVMDGFDTDQNKVNIKLLSYSAFAMLAERGH